MRLPKPGETWEYTGEHFSMGRRGIVVGVGLRLLKQSGDVVQRVWVKWVDDRTNAEDSWCQKRFLCRFKFVEPEPECEPCAECECVRCARLAREADYWRERCNDHVVSYEELKDNLEAEVKELRAEKCSCEPCAECESLRGVISTWKCSHSLCDTKRDELEEELRALRDQLYELSEES